jgi:hypothetical protein
MSHSHVDSNRKGNEIHGNACAKKLQKIYFCPIKNFTRSALVMLAFWTFKYFSRYVTLSVTNFYKDLVKKHERESTPFRDYPCATENVMNTKVLEGPIVEIDPFDTNTVQTPVYLSLPLGIIFNYENNSTNFIIHDTTSQLELVNRQITSRLYFSCLGFHTTGKTHVLSKIVNHERTTPPTTGFVATIENIDGILDVCCLEYSLSPMNWKNNDQRIKRDLLLNVVIGISNIVLIVTRRLTLDEYKVLEGLGDKMCIIVHNLDEISDLGDLEEYWRDEVVNKFDGEQRFKPAKFLKSTSESTGVIHCVLGREGSKAGQGNQLIYEYIRRFLHQETATSMSDRTNLLDRFVKELGVVLPRYISNSVPDDKDLPMLIVENPPAKAKSHHIIANGAELIRLLEKDTISLEMIINFIDKIDPSLEEYSLLEGILVQNGWDSRKFNLGFRRDFTHVRDILAKEIVFALQEAKQTSNITFPSEVLYKLENHRKFGQLHYILSIGGDTRIDDLKFLVFRLSMMEEISTLIGGVLVKTNPKNTKKQYFIEQSEFSIPTKRQFVPSDGTVVNGHLKIEIDLPGLGVREGMQIKYFDDQDLKLERFVTLSGDEMGLLCYQDVDGDLVVSYQRQTRRLIDPENAIIWGTRPDGQWSKKFLLPKQFENFRVEQVKMSTHDGVFVIDIPPKHYKQ